MTVSYFGCYLLIMAMHLHNLRFVEQIVAIVLSTKELCALERWHMEV